MDQIKKQKKDITLPGNFTGLLVNGALRFNVETDDDNTPVLSSVFSGVGFCSPSNERLSVAMRDSGYEVCYEGVWYEFKNGFPPTPIDKEPTKYSEL